jgi:hypothetical protein
MPPDYKLMPTAAVAHMRFEGTWQELDGDTAELLNLTRVKSLSPD